MEWNPVSSGTSEGFGILACKVVYHHLVDNQRGVIVVGGSLDGEEEYGLDGKRGFFSLHLGQRIEADLKVVLWGFVGTCLVIHDTQPTVHLIDAVDSSANFDCPFSIVHCPLNSSLLFRADDAERRVVGIIADEPLQVAKQDIVCDENGALVIIGHWFVEALSNDRQTVEFFCRVEPADIEDCVEH